MRAPFLRPSFDEIGWEPKSGEPARHATLRASLITALGNLNDRDVIAGCRERFARFLAKPESLPPDLRAPVLQVVGRYADEADLEASCTSWDSKRPASRRKQNYYGRARGSDRSEARRSGPCRSL